MAKKQAKNGRNAKKDAKRAHMVTRQWCSSTFNSFKLKLSTVLDSYVFNKVGGDSKKYSHCFTTHE